MSLRKRIAIDYTPAYEQGAGIGRYVRDLVDTLVIADETYDYRLFIAGIAQKPLPALAKFNVSWRTTHISPKWFARLWHRARLPFPVETFTGKVDLFHATDFVLPPTLPQTRTLLTVHDLSFVRVPEAASPRLKAYLDAVVPRSVCRADHVLADSQATKEDLIELYGIQSDKITVLLSGVDPRFKRTSLSLTTRNKYQIGDRPYILSVGTVQPRKNYGRLIQALARLRADGLDLSLVIIGGKGWLTDPIYETLGQTGMREFVRFTGFVDEADLPALYSGAACFAFPSLYEGFGLPILEAMACGVPVVTSNLSSLPEVAGDTALMVDPYDLDALTDALRHLIEDSALRERLIAGGYERARQFTWRASADHLRQIYATLLA